MSLVSSPKWNVKYPVRYKLFVVTADTDINKLQYHPSDFQTEQEIINLGNKNYTWKYGRK